MSEIDQNDPNPLAVDVAGQLGQPDSAFFPVEVDVPVEPEPESVPAPVAPPPPPKRTYTKTPTKPPARQQKQPAPRTQASVLQAALPSPERVKVSKRREDGRVALINYFGYRDLERFRSVEAFIHRHIVPSYGPGEYLVHYVRADGAESAAGEVIVEQPPKEEGTTHASGLDEIARIYREAQDDARSKVADPMEQFQRFQRMQEQMGGGQNAMLMMMLMQQNQPKPPDPTDLVMKIAQALRPPPPPMMPPPGPDPLLAEMMRQNGELTRMMIETLKGDAKDSIGARDLVTMLPSFKDLVKQPEKNHLREALEALELLKRSMSDMQEQKSGFREFAEGLLPKGIDSVTELINTIRQKEGVVGLPAGQQQQAQPQVPVFPQSFAPFARALATAKDGAAAVEAVIHGFQHLGAMPEYRPVLEQLIRLARGGEKEPALDLIQNFLEALIAGGLIPQEKGDLALSTFEQHWDDVVKLVLGAPPSAASNNNEGAVLPLRPVPVPVS